MLLNRQYRHLQDPLHSWWGLIRVRLASSRPIFPGYACCAHYWSYHDGNTQSFMVSRTKSPDTSR